jgi:hypothetical protein
MYFNGSKNFEKPKLLYNAAIATNCVIPEGYLTGSKVILIQLPLLLPQVPSASTDFQYLILKLK